MVSFRIDVSSVMSDDGDPCIADFKFYKPVVLYRRLNVIVRLSTLDSHRGIDVP